MYFSFDFFFFFCFFCAIIRFNKEQFWLWDLLKKTEIKRTLKINFSKKSPALNLLGTGHIAVFHIKFCVYDLE